MIHPANPVDSYRFAVDCNLAGGLQSNETIVVGRISRFGALLAQAAIAVQYRWPASGAGRVITQSVVLSQ